MHQFVLNLFTNEAGINWELRVMLKQLFENFVRKGTDWLFRARSIEAIMLKTACGVVIAVFAGAPLIAVMLRLVIGAVPERYLAAQRTIELVDGWILAICSIVILVALGLIINRARVDARNRSRKRVIVVEARGLRDDNGSSLNQVVSESCRDQIIPVLLDLRNRLDGRVIEPERALEEIFSVHRSLLQHKNNVDRSDLTVVYGGLTSVPYTFLSGVLFDDEGKLQIYDWDRTQERWRSLADKDDGLSFEVSGIESLSRQHEVVMAISFSYPVHEEHLKSAFSHPVVRLTLEGMSSDAHWSKEKQNRLAQHFLEVTKKLSACGVKRIHLVMAAPNSTVFTFGRRYDTRNLPELVVYQFEQRNEIAYPWGILMPVVGQRSAKIIYTCD